MSEAAAKAVIQPLKGYFEDAHTMLASVMENKNLYGFALVSFDEDGTPQFHCINVSPAQLALAGALVTKEAIDDPA